VSPVVDKNALNKIASEYHLSAKVTDKEFDQEFHRRCSLWVNSLLKPGSHVLEMGFGEGNLTRQLLAAGMSVDILEGAELLVQNARGIYGNAVRLHHALFEEFQPEREYDAILATNILEHVADPSITLACIRRWCGFKTRVVVTVPNASSIHRRLAVIMGIQPALNSLSPRDHIVGHMRVYNFPQIKHEVVEAGFEVIDQKGFLLKVLPNSMMKQMSVELVRAMYDIADQLDMEYLADIGLVLRIKS
jgi:2-polyprenyl-3-methyl-5-hydroxy-6-metoxy-1,4-benzoquinol methylase